MSLLVAKCSIELFRLVSSLSLASRSAGCVRRVDQLLYLFQRPL